MLRWRLLLGTLIVALVAGLCWLDATARAPGVWLLPVAAAAALTASAEVLYLARAGGMRPVAWPVYCGNLLLTLAPWAPVAAELLGARLLVARSWLSISPLAVLALGLLLIFVAEMARYEKPGGILANIGVAAFALLYVGLMLSFAVRLRMGWGIVGLASWIIAVKMGDIGAYTVGRLIGRHKMAPRLSPGKTIEGALGALGLACLGSWVTFAWLVPLVTGHAARIAWGWLPFGLAMGAVGILGDLAESLVKRDVGCKDSSTWLPGFGGVLDILDSLLLTAPLAWACWALGLVGP